MMGAVADNPGSWTEQNTRGRVLWVGVYKKMLFDLQSSRYASDRWYYTAGAARWLFTSYK